MTCASTKLSSPRGGIKTLRILGLVTARVSRADFFSRPQTFELFKNNQTIQMASKCESFLGARPAPAVEIGDLFSFDFMGARVGKNAAKIRVGGGSWMLGVKMR
jgi:hypothetical protein